MVVQVPCISVASSNRTHNSPPKTLSDSRHPKRCPTHNSHPSLCQTQTHTPTSVAMQPKPTPISHTCTYCTTHIHRQSLADVASMKTSATNVTQKQVALCHERATLSARGCTHVMQGRSRMTIDPGMATIPGRSTSSFHRPGRHCLHQARSAAR